MSINDWTAALASCLETEKKFQFSDEAKLQSAAVVGSCLLCINRELSSADALAILSINNLSAEAAQQYIASFALHARARVEV